MKKRISIGLCLLLILLFCIATFLITATAFQNNYSTEIAELNEKTSFYDKLKDVYNQVDKTFIKDTSEENFEDAYLSAYIDSLEDPYSAYFTKEQMQAYLSDSKGDMVGIGVHAAFDSESGGIYITSVMPSSPAMQAGLLAGDIIIQVDDIKISSDTYFSAINTIKGVAGKSVSIVVNRGKETLNFSVVRAAIESESVIYEKLDNNIAYITIIEFNGHTAETFKEAIEKSEKDGCEKYIFDVRNNPGGDLNAIVSVLDLLLPEGPIINIVDKNGNTKTESSDKNCLSAPMAVLTNGYTASAAELFTAALRDYELATIVGTKTFGKGTMQTITTLPDGSGLKLSAHYYNPPYGENYNGVGITPDVVIEMPSELMDKFYKLTKEEDNQLQKAIEIINENN